MEQVVEVPKLDVVDETQDEVVQKEVQKTVEVSQIQKVLKFVDVLVPPADVGVTKGTSSGSDNTPAGKRAKHKDKYEG